MSFPETCPFCGEGVDCESERWVTFVCLTMIENGIDARQFQTSTCKDSERLQLLARLAALEAEAKQAREDEEWANERTVLVEFQPMTSGWHASASDGVLGISAEGPTIAAAIRALREKVEGGTR